MEGPLVDKQSIAQGPLVAKPKLKQNSKFFVHGVRPNISLSREVFRETCLSDYHGQGEQMRFFHCPGDHIITEWAYQILKLCSNALVLNLVLEGGYSPKGGATPLSWTQETAVQTAHYNEQQNTRRVVKASWSGNNNLPTDLELHY